MHYRWRENPHIMKYRIYIKKRKVLYLKEKTKNLNAIKIEKIYICLKIDDAFPVQNKKKPRSLNYLSNAHIIFIFTFK